MKYNVGQILTVTEDFETTSMFGGDPKTVKKGTKMYVTAEKTVPQVILPNGVTMRLEKDAEIDGYSVKGLASWVYRYLRAKFPLDEMLDDCDETPETFKEEIEDALEELGMWDNTGNRS